MSKGMEMMMSSMFSMMGVDKETVIGQFKKFHDDTVQTLKDFDARLSSLEAAQKVTNDLLESQNKLLVDLISKLEGK